MEAGLHTGLISNSTLDLKDRGLQGIEEISLPFLDRQVAFYCMRPKAINNIIAAQAVIHFSKKLTRLKIILKLPGQDIA